MSISSSFHPIPRHEWLSLGQTLSQKWQSQLTAAEVEAIRVRSVTDNAVRINHAVRAAAGQCELLLDDPLLDPVHYRDSIRRALISVDAVDRALRKAPALGRDGILYRGDRWSPAIRDGVRDGSITTFTEPSYMALTFGPRVARSYNRSPASLRIAAGWTEPIQMRIEVPRDTRVGYLDHITGWPSKIHEVLLSRGATIEVVTARQRRHVLVVRGRIVGFTGAAGAEEIIEMADAAFDEARRLWITGT